MDVCLGFGGLMFKYLVFGLRLGKVVWAREMCKGFKMFGLGQMSVGW